MCEIQALSKGISQILSALSWAHTIPLLIITLVLVYTKEIGLLIDRIKVFSVSKDGFSVELIQEMSKALLLTEQTGDSTKMLNIMSTVSPAIRREEVQKQFRMIRGIDLQSIDRYLDIVVEILQRQGYRNSSELTELTESPALEVLRKLYINVLGRNIETPLDAVAVVSWGIILHRYGIQREVVEAVKRQLELSSEYRAKSKR